LRERKKKRTSDEDRRQKLRVPTKKEKANACRQLFKKKEGIPSNSVNLLYAHY